MLRCFAFIVLALVTVPSSVTAGSATLGNVSINLPPPTGFCELSESNASDKNAIAVVSDLLLKSGNKLLGMSADCGQLSAWHTGERQFLDDYSQYQTAIAGMDRPPSASISQTCAALRAQGDKILAQQLPDLKERIENALKKVKMNEVIFIGVLADEPTACYAGLVQQLHAETGGDKTQVILFAVTVVKDRSVFVYRFANLSLTKSEDALAKLRDDVAAMYAANK